MTFEEMHHDLLMAEAPAECTKALFERVVAATHAMGFTHCAFGIRMPFPFTRPRVEMFNNYSNNWRRRYGEMNYVMIDPSVALASRSNRPALWSADLAEQQPQFWDEARDAGLHHGWFQSVTETSGVVGMLTVARSSEPVTAAELKALDTKLSWLAHVVHHAFARLLITDRNPSSDSKLTAREIEILRWTADGKTSGEISNILSISDNTVNFHVKNAMAKLQTSNKTSATVRAAMLGMLR